MRDRARAVVIGGGVGSCSILYWLARLGAEPGTPVEVEIFGEWVGGEVAAEPLHDPEGARLRS